MGCHNAVMIPRGVNRLEKEWPKKGNNVYSCLRLPQTAVPHATCGDTDDLISRRAAWSLSQQAASSLMPAS